MSTQRVRKRPLTLPTLVDPCTLTDAENIIFALVGGFLGDRSFLKLILY